MGLAQYLFGHSAEERVAQFLQKNGFEVLAKNYHSKFGEIDIIAQKAGILHFIEVKATSKSHQTIERVTPQKLAKIIKTIDFYMLKTASQLPYQIDVASVGEEGVILVQNVSF